MGNFTKAHSKWWEDNARETERNDSKRKKAIMQGQSASAEERRAITKDTAGDGIQDKNGNYRTVPGVSDFDAAQTQGWNKKKILPKKKVKKSKDDTVITIPQ